MGITQRTIILAAASVAVLAIGVPARPGAQTPAPEGFAYADACKSCHAAIHEAWSKTKHARTINRLSAADQQKECIGCHTTGPGGKIDASGKFVNANVQCESCHGAGAAHAADPAVRTGLTRKPKLEACTTCHNDKSPHYRGFYYDGMLGFSHPVPKS